MGGVATDSSEQDKGGAGASAAHTQALMERRQRLLGPNMSTFYDQPLHIVKGEGVWLWDADGRKYLDCYNNVPHVGHCNPRVVDAICRQAARLNTHTRYLHNGILDYVERLTATFDDGLDTALLTCTGSEANDVALRMASAMTGKSGLIATDATYHGNTTAVAKLSASNRSPHGSSSHIRWVPAPDSYRPLGGTAGDAHALAFADAVSEAIADLEASGHGFAAIIVCPHFVNEGFPSLPPGWLAPTLAKVRAAGGLFIADEVQPGFGRLGSHMWGHQRQGIVPDIVTMGKPMANGHPVGGVVTRAEIMAAFRSSYRYFNTFGGNPVSCAAAMAVLEEIEQQGLMENALSVGAYAKQGLEQLAVHHRAIGDVRGQGLIFGAEMVTDRQTKRPAGAYTDKLINAIRHRGIILSKLGRHKNALKIRPPMPFQREHVDLLIEILDAVMRETAMEQD